LVREAREFSGAGTTALNSHPRLSTPFWFEKLGREQTASLSQIDNSLFKQQIGVQ
jgi:uncharacterized protein YfaA (DUF2138 family)